MKILRSLVVTLIALLLTGCYTQLQYSQKMKKVTDKEQRTTSAYSDSEGQQVPEDTQAGYEEYNEEIAYAEEQYYNGDDYVPVYYKNYEYAEKYSDCVCNPYTYNEYNFYGPDYGWRGYHSYHSFSSHLTLSDFYFYKWHPRFYNYHRYYGYPRFGFSISWGSPYFAHSFYYNSFYDPFYDPYWYGYHRPFGYNYRYYYGNYGYHGKTRNVDSNRRYGPRNIGTNRVVNNGSRSRDARVSGRSATVNNSPRTRSRSSVGTTRTRSSSKRSDGSRVNRTRSRSDSGSNGTSRVRSRSRDNNIQSDNSRDRVYIDRTDRKSEPVIIDRETYERMRRTRARTLNESTSGSRSLRDRSNDVRSRSLQRAPTVDLNRINRERSRPTFFQRMKSFFENNTSRIINDSRTRSNPRIRTRSSSSNGGSSTIGRSSSSNNRGSVNRSRSSSSSNSRSRGGSSRSRSGGRDGGSSSSGSDRSRGN